MMVYYKKECGFDSYVVEEDGCFLVYWKEDNKILKFVVYFFVDLYVILSC